jgi:site-specific recombinase XerD
MILQESLLVTLVKLVDGDAVCVTAHVYSVTAIQRGISLPVIQHLLGRDRLTTAEIYLNLSPEDMVREFREKR